jgi:hypothetical protein
MQQHSPPNYSQPARTQASFYQHQQHTTSSARTVNGKYFPPSPQISMPEKSQQSVSLSSYVTKVQSAPAIRHGSGQVVENDITAARILMNCSRNNFVHPTMSSPGSVEDGFFETIFSRFLKAIYGEKNSTAQPRPS